MVACAFTPRKRDFLVDIVTRNAIMALQSKERMMFEKLFKWKIPQALTSADWRSWHDVQSRERPLAYWFCDTLPDWFSGISRQVKGVPYALRMKYITRYDIIRTDLPRAYHDGDTRMLHGMFGILVDFVEIEKTHMQYVFNETTDPRPWYARRPFRFLSHRNPQAGLDYLAWEISLDDPKMGDDSNPDQACKAREILELYTWWKHQRPQRPDAYDASGWTAFCQEHYENKQRDPLDEHSSEQSDQLLLRLREIEQAYDQEDQDQLVRLVNVRKHLWT